MFDVFIFLFSLRDPERLWAIHNKCIADTRAPARAIAADIFGNYTERWFSPAVLFFWCWRPLSCGAFSNQGRSRFCRRRSSRARFWLNVARDPKIKTCWARFRRPFAGYLGAVLGFQLENRQRLNYAGNSSAAQS